MAFQRRWDEEVQQYVVDRDLTGPPKPAAETGTVVSQDGTIVAHSETVAITPATPVNVDLPSPNEPLVMSDGRINHHWWRFFNQLYLRTGGVQDNINRTPTTLLGAGSVDALVLSGKLPTIQHNRVSAPTTGTVTVSGKTAQPALSSPVEAPSVGSITITGAAPTIS
jgi:hypothetical protein